MFNFLVANNATAWETDQLIRMDATPDRFKQYSNAPEAAEVSVSRPDTLKQLEQAPALLMYERGSEAENKDTVRYGYLHDINLEPGKVACRFTEEGTFPRSVLDEYADRLGIHSWEANRTHWAIKNGGIPSEMLRKLMPTYDVVLSFAGEQRPYVERVAKYLRANNVRVFFDTYEEVNLWGKNLGEHLDLVYRKSGKFCVMFISEDYAKKMWTRQERRSALARAIREKHEYILPARFDKTELDGISPDVQFVSAEKKSAAVLAKMILAKLGRPLPVRAKRSKGMPEKR